MCYQIKRVLSHFSKVRKRDNFYCNRINITFLLLSSRYRRFITNVFRTRKLTKHKKKKKNLMFSDCSNAT